MTNLAVKHQRLAALRPLSPESVASLGTAWDVRVVYESNSIEGNTLTLRETELVLSKGVTISGKPLKDHLEAVNLAAAWERVKNSARSAASITEQDLLDLHREWAVRISEDYSGHYRTHAIRLRGSNLVPPHADRVPDLMTELLAETTAISGTVERAAHLHHGITSILPFTGGNGQIARLAMNFVLLSGGYPPISIPTNLRQDYYTALEAADGGNFQAWQDFINTRLEAELDTWLEALESALPGTQS